MFETIFIVAKNMLRRAIQCSKSSSPITSAIRPLVSSITFLLWPSASSSSITLGDLTLYHGTTRRHGLAHWNFRRDGGHSATRQRDSAITRPSFLHSFSSLRSFLQISVHGLFLNPNTWKSRILHQLLAQKKHLRTTNLSK
ncbi:hypothetical protein H5410_061645 [Solanum commersonii]|uniref:Uncharacterized protein n=1 Tax=Solanum commersonii TaxID=4109 RepID=A0A9J5W984_SOLCO|nr:hypothetical protein H5410_061645 [Solanum commersonii]